MNTRFNPTTSGDLHLGHIYMAKLNQVMAYETGGKFVLRFDDNSRHIMRDHGGPESMALIAQRQSDDLLWMGIHPSKVVYQSEEEEEVKQFLAQSKFQMVIDHAFEGMRDTEPVIMAYTPTISPMRMATFIIAERVIQDRWSDVDTVIRGIDLLQNHTLYMYFCALFGFRFPKMYYMPRLMATADDGPYANVSKTMGNWKVSRFKELGASPEDVYSILEEACLVDRQGPWHIHNIKDTPRLIDADIEEAICRARR